METKNRFKKRIALILVAVMLISMLPVNVFATGNEGTAYAFTDSFDNDYSTSGYQDPDGTTYQWAFKAGSAGATSTFAKNGVLNLDYTGSSNDKYGYSAVILNATDSEGQVVSDSWDNYSVEMTAKKAAGNNYERLGLVGRYTESDDGSATFYYASYYFRNSVNTVYLTHISQSKAGEQTSTAIANSMKLTVGLNEEFTMKMSYEGTTIKVYMNGEEVITTTDDKCPTGTAGIQNTRKGAAEIYDFKLAFPITEQPEQPECEHEYDNDCDATCNICQAEREVVGHVDNANDGNHNCDECGAADVTGHNYVKGYCSECGAKDGTATFVAKVGDKEYLTLADAIADANGETIKLLADVTTALIRVNGIELTIDLGGKTLTREGNSIFYITNGGKLTVTNGKLVSTGGNAAIYSDGNGAKKNAITLNGVELNSNYFGVYHNGNYYGVDVQIINTTIIDILADGAGVFLSGNAAWGAEKQNTLTISDSTIEGATAVEVKYTNVTVENSTLTATGSKSVADNANGSCTTGYALALTNNGKEATIGAITLNGTNTLTGGAMVKAGSTVNVTTNAAEQVEAPADYKWDEDGKLVAKDYVAQIGDVKYESLKAAIEAAENDATITLLQSVSGSGIVIDKSITIDFGGYTYTFNSPAVGSKGTQTLGFQILENNTVVLQNGKLEVAEAAKTDFAFLIQNYANLTISGMTLDGTYLDRYTIKEEYNYSYVLSNNSGNVAIVDTTIIVNDGGDAYAFDACKYDRYAVPTVTVSGNSNISGIIEVSGGNLVLNGGTFTGNLVYTSGSVSVLGGSFNSDVSEFISEGEHMDENDGIYTICTGAAQTPVMKNEVEASCTTAGSYDMVTYCACGKELSRETITGSKLPHKDEDENNACDVCGQVMSGIDGDIYYVDGEKSGIGGLIEIDGSYYYVTESGKVYMDGKRTLNAKQLGEYAEIFAEGLYTFDSEGKMTVNNGIVDGYYYVNGQKSGVGGLVMIEDNYYYITKTGKVYVNGTRTLNAEQIGAYADIFATGKYTFDAEGRLIDET